MESTHKYLEVDEDEFTIIIAGLKKMIGDWELLLAYGSPKPDKVISMYSAGIERAKLVLDKCTRALEQAKKQEKKPVKKVKSPSKVTEPEDHRWKKEGEDPLVVQL